MFTSYQQEKNRIFWNLKKQFAILHYIQCCFFYLDLNIKLNKNICVTKSKKIWKTEKHIHNKTQTEVEKKTITGTAFFTKL